MGKSYRHFEWATGKLHHPTSYALIVGVKFEEMLAAYHLEQHVKEPTYIDGHILDIVIFDNEVSLVPFVNLDEHISDHHSDNVCLNVIRKKIKWRRLHFIN